MKWVKIDGLVFFLFSVESRQQVSDMPHVPYENQTVFINSAFNVQELERTPASTSTFALDNATRQPRRRAESMPWSRQTSIFKSHQNSLQLKPFRKVLPIPHFVQAEQDRSRDGFKLPVAGWFTSRKSYGTRESARLLSHHVISMFLHVILMLLSQLIIFFLQVQHRAKKFWTKPTRNQIFVWIRLGNLLSLRNHIAN